MAVTADEVVVLLKELELKHDRHSADEIVTLFGTESYVNVRGDKALLIVISLMENGEYIAFRAPLAYRAVGDHVDAFLRVCAMIQWRTKLIQFEYDDRDGEVRPVIEFPLEEGKLVKGQVLRCLRGLCTLVDEYHDTLTRTLETGEIVFTDPFSASANAAQIAALQALLQKLETGGAAPSVLDTVREQIAGLRGPGSGPREL